MSDYETFLENEDRKLAKNMLLERGCLNCDWLHGGEMKCGKRVDFFNKEYVSLPEEMTCSYWKNRYQL